MNVKCRDTIINKKKAFLFSPFLRSLGLGYFSLSKPLSKSPLLALTLTRADVRQGKEKKQRAFQAGCEVLANGHSVVTSSENQEILTPKATIIPPYL
jgi:hypothetical protein